MSTVTWLHLSDFHFCADQQHSWDENVVLKALLKDVVECVDQHTLRLDFILVTGDLAYSGKPAQYILAEHFLDQLLQTTGLDKSRLFLIPGNHDVDRDLVSPGARAIAGSLTDRNSVNSVLADLGDRQLMLARFKGYADFVKSYFGKQRKFDHEDYFYVENLDLADLQVGLLGLNSAWISASDIDKTSGLLVGERQARMALERVVNADLKIAFLHHPFDWLREFDRTDVEALLCAECDLLLHGHMHQVGLLQTRTPDAEAVILAAGACYTTRQYANSYNFLELDLAAKTGTVYFRRYSDTSGGFWARDTLTYKNVPNGEYTFALPSHLQRTTTKMKHSCSDDDKDSVTIEGGAPSKSGDTISFGNIKANVASIVGVVNIEKIEQLNIGKDEV